MTSLDYCENVMSVMLGVDCFIVGTGCACHFKTIWQNSANQGEEGGGRGRRERAGSNSCPGEDEAP